MTDTLSRYNKAHNAATNRRKMSSWL